MAVLTCSSGLRAGGRRGARGARGARVGARRVLGEGGLGRVQARVRARTPMKAGAWVGVAPRFGVEREGRESEATVGAHAGRGGVRASLGRWAGWFR
eukprot:3058149-Prymnesium_polylepis.2